jgi:hypothetical protein
MRTHAAHLARAHTDQGYRLIPFIFEFRCVVDWTVTKTTLTFGQWLKIEDIYASNYDIKSCTRASACARLRPMYGA